MGMFDWYQPSEKLQCPVCKITLTEWQGKDAACGLFVWKQSESSPVSQLVDEEVALLDEDRRKQRLPEKFVLYSYDCEKHCVMTEGKTENGVWTDTRISFVEEVGKRCY